MSGSSERTRFVIVGLQRSGTTVTQVVLNGHPQTNLMPSEVLGPFYEQGIGAFTGCKESFATRKASYLPMFDAMAAVFATERSRAFGIKAAVSTHAQAIDFCNCVREYLPSVRVILVTRDDLAAQLGSLLRAEQTGVWHAWEGVTASETGQLTIPIEKFHQYALDSKRAVMEMRSLSQTHALMEINYERDILGEAGYGRIFEFLGIDNLPVTWLRMSKLNPEPQTYIENYAELAAMLAELPTVSEEEVRASREARLLEISRQESFEFLIHRANDRLWRKQPDEALADLRIALATGKFLEPSAIGSVYALMEEHVGAARDQEAVREALARIDELGGANPYFLCGRGVLRVRLGRLVDAKDDLVAALLGDPHLDAATAEKALGDLDRCMTAVSNAEEAQAMLHALRDRFEESPAYICLQGHLLCATGQTSAGLPLLQRAAALRPDLTRAVELLRTWTPK